MVARAFNVDFSMVLLCEHMLSTTVIGFQWIFVISSRCLWWLRNIQGIPSVLYVFLETVILLGVVVEVAIFCSPLDLHCFVYFVFFYVLRHSILFSKIQLISVVACVPHIGYSADRVILREYLSTEISEISRYN